MIDRSQFCRGALALGTLGALTGLGTRKARAEIPIRIGVGVDSAYAPFFLADQDKLFEQAGFKAQFTQFAQGGEVLDAIVAGQVDIGAAAEPTTMIRIARADVRPMFIMGESGTYIKLAVRSDITDARQIKKFGMVPGNVSEYAMERTFATFNIDPKSVTIVKAGPPELPALLVRGDIDGFFNIEPWPTIATRQGGKVLLNSGDVGYAYTYWVTASGAWLDAHQSEARQFAQVIAKTCKMIIADPSTAARAAQAKVKIPQQQTLDFLKEVDVKVRDFTPKDMTSYDHIADFLAEKKITPSRVDYKKALQVGLFTA